MVGILTEAVVVHASQAGKTLSARKWKASFSAEGYIDISKTLGRIQRGVWIVFMLTAFDMICHMHWE